MGGAKTVAVVGAGATGAYLAARLVDSGARVTLIARGASHERISADGIEIIDADGNRHTSRPWQVITPDEAAEPVDLVLFCVKTYDTESASALVGPLLGDDGHVLCLQNGVKNEEILAQAFGPSRVLSGVLYIGSERVAPGVISCSSPPRIVVGPFDGADPGVSTDVEELFSRAGITATMSLDVRAAKWQKFLFNCGLNPLTAITSQRMGQLLAQPAAMAVFDALVDEAAAVAVADGAPLVPGYREQVDATARRMDISSSMAEDLQAGRAIELDAFTGYVLELGERTGVATPATRVVHGILTALDSARTTSTRG
ncbi:MAG TPA: ketopantoate reductase family protein [Nocardioidaceae bacterium]|nr:ketopantoate reductase family protein [Nocardioidaceae bacterium]